MLPIILGDSLQAVPIFLSLSERSMTAYGVDVPGEHFYQKSPEPIGETAFRASVSQQYNIMK